MNKILAIGDPHFQNNNKIETDIMFDSIQNLLNSTNFDFVVVLGDILHSHDKISLEPLDRSIKFLKMIQSLSKKLYIIIGNHDRCNNQDFLTDKHPFNSLKSWEKTIIVDKVIINEINGVNFCFVPYVPIGRYYEALSTEIIDYTNICCFFSHQEFSGCKINILTKSNADIWDIDYPMNISGHIHNYEIVQKNIIYTGTPFQHTTSDNIDKSISIFEFENLNYKSHTRYYLDIPKKITLTLTVEEFLDYTPPENSKIKINLKGSLSSIKNVLKLKSIIELIEKYNIKIVIIANKINNPIILDNSYSKSSLEAKIFNKLENNKDLENIFKEIF